MCRVFSMETGRDQDHPHGKDKQKSKMAVWGGLTNSCEKKRSEKQRMQDEPLDRYGVSREVPVSDLKCEIDLRD